MSKGHLNSATQVQPTQNLGEALESNQNPLFYYKTLSTNYAGFLYDYTGSNEESWLLSPQFF